MQRLVSADYRESIARAIDLVPPGIMDRLRHVEFLTGTDPVWAGLHGYASALDGRGYAASAHCAYRFHTADRSTTIVLPVLEPPHVVVHELGHALHEVIGFAHVAVPVTWYAKTNDWEAFAESFVASLYWYGDQAAFHADEATRALFAELAA